MQFKTGAVRKRPPLFVASQRANLPSTRKGLVGYARERELYRVQKIDNYVVSRYDDNIVVKIGEALMRPDQEVATTNRLVRITRLIRACFQDMKKMADGLHADIGLNASTRAVLEFLAENGPSTVPDIAKAKNVTRQHIQQLADALVESGFAAFEANPAHKRSHLVRMLEKGASAFRVMQAREATLIETIAASFAAAELDQAAQVLERLRKCLAVETNSL